MKKPFRKFSRPGRRAGVTLVEVLAGLVICSGVLVGLVLAQSRLIRQQALAQQKYQAVEAADELLASLADGEPLQAAQGQIDRANSLKWHWRLDPAPGTLPVIWQADLWRLELYSEAAAPGSDPLVRVDFFASRPPAPAPVQETPDDPEGF